MPTIIDLTEDDGAVKVLGPDGLEIDLDLYRIHDRLVEITQAHKDKPSEEFADALLQFMQQCGLPRTTYKQALYFQKCVFDAVAVLKNGDGRGGAATMPASPASTVPEL
jgi:hypothetical protein